MSPNRRGRGDGCCRGARPETYVALDANWHRRYRCQRASGLQLPLQVVAVHRSVHRASDWKNLLSGLRKTKVQDHHWHQLMDNKCPVDHKSNSKAWQTLVPASGSNGTEAGNGELSKDRVTSSIPRSESANWVYPSEAQFFAAMARKQHNPRGEDMKTIVPIHNAVNERAWQHVRDWEEGRGGEKCGGIKLVSFQGKPSQLSLRARWNTLLGYHFNL